MLLHKDARNDANRRERCIQIPNVKDAIRKGDLYYALVFRILDGRNQEDVGGSVTALECIGNVGREASIHEFGVLGIHAVLEQHTTEDNSRRSGHATDKAKHGCRGGCLTAGNIGLQGQQGREEEHAHAKAKHNLVDDNFGIGSRGADVDEQANTKEHDKVAESHNLNVTTGAMDDEADGTARDAGADDDGENQDTGAEGRSQPCGLKVQWQIPLASCDYLRGIQS